MSPSEVSVFWDYGKSRLVRFGRLHMSEKHLVLYLQPQFWLCRCQQHSNHFPTIWERQVL